MGAQIKQLFRGISATPVVAAVSVAGLLALVWGVVPLRSFEAWWHLLMGRVISDFNAVPAANHLVYAVAEDSPSLIQPWLAQRGMFALYKFLDIEALLWARNHLIAIAFAAATLAAGLRAPSARLWVIPLGLLGALSCSPALVMEPQLFALVVMSMMLALGAALERSASVALHLGGALVTVGLTALWANLDVSFGLGALIPLSFALNRRKDDRRIAGIWAITAIIALTLAPLLNPRGAELFSYTLKVLTLYPGHPQTLSWGWLIPFTSLAGALLGVGLLISAGLWARAKSLKVGDGLLLVVLAVMAVTHARASIWFGVALPFCLAPALEALLKQRDTTRELGLKAKLALMAVSLSLPILTQPIFVTHAMLAKVISPFAIRGVDPHATTITTEVPVEAVEMIKRQHPKPILYVDRRATGYALFELEPKQLRPMVSADYRIELLDEPRWKLAAQLETTDLWRGLFQQWGVNVLLLHKERQRELITRAEAQQDWLKSYDEGQWVYFVHMKR